jgi:cytochrome c oxidase subunit 4
MTTEASAEEQLQSDGAGGGSKEEEHVLPVKTYLKVYGALLVLTFVTVQVSLLDLGDPAIFVAMAVAIVKAALVALYFMHLRYDSGFNRFVFLGSLLFLVIFFVFTLIDLGTRGSVLEEQDNFVLRDEQAQTAKPKPAPKPAE